MNIITININRPITTDELKEISELAENQKTTDKFVDTELHIVGDYATIDAKIDEEGNIIIL